MIDALLRAAASIVDLGTAAILVFYGLRTLLRRNPLVWAMTDP
jgi:hypothetical protein